MTLKHILKKQIELVKPDKETFDKISQTTDKFCSELRKKLKSKKIKADVFIGGSLAKNTLVKKEKYDADVFVRFENLKDMNKLSGVLRKAKKVHGSRDYYQVNVSINSYNLKNLKKTKSIKAIHKREEAIYKIPNENKNTNKSIIIEIVPVLKIKSPEQAENVTDLSYFHVNYVLKKIKQNKKITDEIVLAKTFAYANNCYGAESYIQGFSGYALELLICYYGSFLKFITSISSQNVQLGKSISRNKKQQNIENSKIIIDSGKLYKNKNEVLNLMNKSKLESPIILVDPTFKERNALAGLGKRTFEKFKNICKKFLAKPSDSFFEKKHIGDELKRKYKDKLEIINVKTNRQAGDIAGTKSRKFFEFFVFKLKREFEIKVSEFDYNEKENSCEFYFVVDKKKDEVIRGPPITSVHNLSNFKKAHPKAIIKNHIAYAKIKHDLSFDKWFKLFLKKEKKIIKQMGIKKIG